MPVEIVARFAGTVVASTVVLPGRDFRIGTAPDVDLAVPGFLSFPLVDRRSARRIRIPVGAAATRVVGDLRQPIREADAQALPGEPVELVIGHIHLTLSVASPRTPIARPAIGDVRPLGYVAGALVAHLALWAAAMLLASPPPPRTVPVVHHAYPIPTTPLPPAPPPPDQRRPRPPAHLAAASPRAGTPDAAATATAAPAQVPPPSPAARAGRRAAESILGSDALAAGMRGLMGTVDLRKALAETGPLYREEEANAGGFGNRGGRFDPTTCPTCGTIPTGRYATISTGRGAGEHYDLPGTVGSGPLEVLVCEGRGCAAAGAIDRASVTSWVTPHLSELAACYEAAAPAGDGAVELAFTIGADGSVRGVHARGLAAVGPCVAGVVGSISFPRNDRATRVTYPIQFRHAG